ncbi:alpha/beta hydrolase fold domain-containing protein [Chryseolinea serpens]|nr:alpha/beta hydrolase [Chryseolinea serpens]
MKQTLKIFLMGILVQLSYTGLTAQSIADSTLQKIGGERAFYETLGKIYPAEHSVTVTEATIAGVKSYWFNEGLTGQKHIIIYLHGGVYALGSINSYRAMISHLSKSINLPIVYIEYSRAPENPYPAATNESLKVYRELRNKYPGYKISVIGDSAGGGLAIQLVYNSIESKLPAPNALALISPWVDLKTQNNSYITRQSVDPILSKKMLHDHALLYNPTHNKAADPSELKFRTFPPVLLLVGTDEVLNDDSKNFYNYIKPVQKQARLKEFPGQKHVWLVSDINSKASVEAMDDIKGFITSK